MNFFTLLFQAMRPSASKCFSNAAFGAKSLLTPVLDTSKSSDTDNDRDASSSDSFFAVRTIKATKI